MSCENAAFHRRAPLDKGAGRPIASRLWIWLPTPWRAPDFAKCPPKRIGVPRERGTEACSRFPRLGGMKNTFWLRKHLPKRIRIPVNKGGLPAPGRENGERRKEYVLTPIETTSKGIFNLIMRLEVFLIRVRTYSLGAAPSMRAWTYSMWARTYSIRAAAYSTPVSAYPFGAATHSPSRPPATRGPIDRQGRFGAGAARKHPVAVEWPNESAFARNQSAVFVTSGPKSGRNRGLIFSKCGPSREVRIHSGLMRTHSGRVRTHSLRMRTHFRQMRTESRTADSLSPIAD